MDKVEATVPAAAPHPPAPPAVSAKWIYFVSRRDGRTGLYTYGQDGSFFSFIDISVLPDVLGAAMITSYGEVTLAGLEDGVLLQGQ